MKVTTGVDIKVVKSRGRRPKREDSNGDSDWRLSQMYNWSESGPDEKGDARRGLAY